MSIRITGGALRGSVLREPITKGVRPTSARVREALFSILGHDLTGVRMLDAFGGAGLIGIEAMSRGAEVTVVERDRKAFKALVKRGQEVDATWNLRLGDVYKLIGTLSSFDGIFADPPYSEDPSVALTGLAPRARAWMVLETDRTTDAPQTACQLKLDRVRDYGGTRLWVYRA